MIDQHNLCVFHLWPDCCSRLVRMSVKQRSALSDNNLYMGKKLGASDSSSRRRTDSDKKCKQYLLITPRSYSFQSHHPLCVLVARLESVRVYGKAPRWMLTPLSQRFDGYTAMVKHSAFAFPLMFFIWGKPNMSENTPLPQDNSCISCPSNMPVFYSTNSLLFLCYRHLLRKCVWYCIFTMQFMLCVFALLKLL